MKIMPQRGGWWPDCLGVIVLAFVLVLTGFGAGFGTAKAAPITVTHSIKPRLTSGDTYYFTNKTNSGRLWFNQNVGAYQTKTVASGHVTDLYVEPSGIDQELQDGFELACVEVDASAGDVDNSSFANCTGSIGSDPASVVWTIISLGGGYYALGNAYSTDHNTCGSGEDPYLSSGGMSTGVDVSMACGDGSQSNQMWTATVVTG